MVPLSRHRGSLSIGRGGHVRKRRRGSLSFGISIWETIIKYCKDKWSILGRTLPQPEYDDNLLTQHIKDLIFQFHGDSFYTDWKCDLGWDNQQVHSKGLVIEELAAVILEKVKEKTKSEEDNGENPTGTLSDREEIKMVPMKPAPSYDDEYCEDLPFEYESHKVRPVKGFNDYTKLNETVAVIDVESQEECINFCLDLVKKNVGSFDPVEMLNVALNAASSEVKMEVVKNYLRHMIYDYLCNEKGQVKIVGIGDPKDVQENVPEEVYEQGLEILCDDIADAVIDRLAEENGFGYERV